MTGKSRIRLIGCAAVALLLGGCNWTWSARVNVGADGSASGVDAVEAVISASGSTVAFTSPDPALVPGAPPGPGGRDHVYLRELASGVVSRVSDAVPDYAAVRSLALDRDGRSVVFIVDDLHEGRAIAYRIDRDPGLLHRLEPGFGDPRTPRVDRVRIADDGSLSLVEFGYDDEPGRRLATFDAASLADLEEYIGEDVVVGLAGDGRAFYVRTSVARVPADTDGLPDVYRRSLAFEPDQLIDVALPIGAPPVDQAVSADGSTVVTRAVDPADGQLRAYATEVATGVSVLASLGDHGPLAATEPVVVSADGDVVGFTDGAGVYARNLRHGRTQPVVGIPAWDGGRTRLGSLTADGSVFALRTSAPVTLDDVDQVADAVVVSTVRPDIATVTPTALAPGTSQVVTVTGSGFTPGSAVLVGGPGVTTSAVMTVSPSELRFTVTLAADAAAGPRDLTIFQPAPGTGHRGATSSASWCQACLTVT